MKGGIIQNNIGTTIYQLDMSLPSVYDSIKKILYIPVGMETFIGEFWLYNGGGQIIKYIVNSSGRFASKFVNKDDGTILTFQCDHSVTFATTDELICNVVTPHSFRISGRIDGEDSIYVRRLGEFNGIEQVYIYL
jgi:hypothetical protein